MENKKYGMGWQRDLPDFRDYTPAHEKIRKLFNKSKALKPPKAGIKKSVDLTKWCGECYIIEGGHEVFRSGNMVFVQTQIHWIV